MCWRREEGSGVGGGEAVEEAARARRRVFDGGELVICIRGRRLGRNGLNERRYPVIQ